MVLNADTSTYKININKDNMNQSISNGLSRDFKHIASFAAILAAAIFTLALLAQLVQAYTTQQLCNNTPIDQMSTHQMIACK